MMSIMNEEKKTSLWLSVLFMLGSYSFGFNLHNIIHEFGHAFAILIQGGKVTGFYFHPFEACLNFSTYVPNHILLYAGGSLFGGSATIIFAILAWRYRTPFIVPFVAACSAGLTTTARWMLITPFSDVFTDYSSMVALGVPVSLIVFAGIIYLVVGAAVRILYLPLLGVSYETGIARRLIIYELGVLPYHIVVSMYAYSTKGGQLRSIFIGLSMAAVYLSVEALLSQRLPKWFSFFRKIAPVRVRTLHVAVTWIGVIVLIIVMFLVSSQPE